MNSNETVSVVLPTLDAERYLHDLVDALQRQADPPHEIIVVDSSSRDATVEIANRMGCRTEVIARSAFNHGATRNLGASLATGNILVFMTQDALPADEHFLGTLVHPVAAGSVAAAFARQLPRADANPTERFAREFNYPRTPFVRTQGDIASLGLRAFFFSDVASAFRRDVFEAMGRFPPTTIANEDMLMCAKLLRAGHAVEYVPAAMVYHSHDYTLAQQFRRFFDVGVALSRGRHLLAGASADREGLRYLHAQTQHLLAEGQWGWLARSFAEAGAKFCGLHLGRRERYLPAPIKRRLSMHRSFWRSQAALDRTVSS